MEKYRIVINKTAENDLKKIYKSGNKNDISKIETFFIEIAKHPREGSGQPEQLKYYSGEVWSRKVNKKDRFVYEIFEEEIIITIIKVLGHYGDK